MSSVQVCYLTNIQGTCNNLICTYPVTRKWNKARQLRSCAALLPRWRNAIAGQDVSGGFARLLYAFGRRRRAFLLAAALFDQWAHPTRVRCPPPFPLQRKPGRERLRGHLPLESEHSPPLWAMQVSGKRRAEETDGNRSCPLVELLGRSTCFTPSAKWRCKPYSGWVPGSAAAAAWLGGVTGE